MKFIINNAKRDANGGLYVTSSTIETSDGKTHFIPLSYFPTGSDEELLNFAQLYEDGTNFDEYCDYSSDSEEVIYRSSSQAQLIAQTCQNMTDDEEFNNKILTS